MPQDGVVLLKLSLLLDSWTVKLEASFLALAIAVAASVFVAWTVRHRLKRYKLVKLNISLGKIGKAELRPSVEDIQVAHKIWTQLVTRKAAIPIDPDHDVIIEIYDSWYALFTQVRELIGSIPAELVREEESTRELVRIATATLNQGLRPHLTRWQARFRGWYEANIDQLKTCTPQELQRKYPEYDELVSDMRKINGEMIAYAAQLKHLIDGQT